MTAHTINPSALLIFGHSRADIDVKQSTQPMTSPHDIFPKLSGSQIYSTVDFSNGYWAIPMD